MASSSTSGDGENAGMNLDDETSTVAQPDLTHQEGQLMQGIENLKAKLDLVSQRQDEMMGLIGAPQEQDG
jgi:hypothetical protein